MVLYIPEDGKLHSHRRETLKHYRELPFITRLKCYSKVNYIFRGLIFNTTRYSRFIS
jgi:hypothetical protein